MIDKKVIGKNNINSIYIAIPKSPILAKSHLNAMPLIKRYRIIANANLIEIR